MGLGEGLGYSVRVWVRVRLRARVWVRARCAAPPLRAGDIGRYREI